MHASTGTVLCCHRPLAMDMQWTGRAASFDPSVGGIRAWPWRQWRSSVFMSVSWSRRRARDRWERDMIAGSLCHDWPHETIRLGCMRACLRAAAFGRGQQRGQVEPSLRGPRAALPNSPTLPFVPRGTVRPHSAYTLPPCFRLPPK
jgi:hypothetical protein